MSLSNSVQWFFAALFSLLIGALPVHGAKKDSNTFSKSLLKLNPGDVVAFVGGGDVAAAQHTGHLEALLAVEFRGNNIRFRNFGWEGDTVFVQPRDVGFPNLSAQLKRAGTTLIFLQFGRTETLNGKEALPKFVAAYEKLLDDLRPISLRQILVTPPPYEKSRDPLPDLSQKNADLEIYVQAIRKLASERNLPLIDLFAEIKKLPANSLKLTDNGFQLTPQGHAQAANTFMRAAGFDHKLYRNATAGPEGVWKDSKLERVRQAVLVKNRFCFDYYRPQNWAFLGGDRTTQPSSRDHRNPNVRWFPEEMEKFLPLIQGAELRIEEAATKVLKP